IHLPVHALVASVVGIALGGLVLGVSSAMEAEQLVGGVRLPIVAAIPAPIGVTVRTPRTPTAATAPEAIKASLFVFGRLSLPRVIAREVDHCALSFSVDLTW